LSQDDGNPMRILLVDDDVADREILLQALLRNDGTEPRVRQADTVEDALAALREQPFDAIVLALPLSGPDGNAPLRRVLEETRATPVIVLTEELTPEMGLEAIRQGAQDFLIKGRTDGDVLRRSLRYAIARARAEARTRHLSEILRAIRNVNQLIVREKDPDRLVRQACELLLEARHYYGVWILARGSSALPRCVAHAGFGGNGNLFRDLERADWEPPCCEQALASPSGFAALDPAKDCRDCSMRESAGASGLACCAMTHGGRVYGFLGVASGIRLNPGGEESALLRELAGDIAYALHGIETARQRRETHRVLDEIFRGSRDGFVMVDAAGRITDANQAFCDMLGYSLEELKALDSFYQITPAEWIEWERTEIWENRLLKQSYSGLYEKEYIRKDGTVFPVELQSYTVHDDAGRIVYLWGVARDITKRKQIERQMEDSRRRLRVAADAAGFGVWDRDVETGRLMWDDRMYELYGMTPERFHGDFEAWKACLHPDDVDAAIHAIERAESGERAFDTEFRIIRPDDEIRHLKAYAQVLRDDEGRPVRMIGVNYDITDMRRAEAALRSSEEQKNLILNATSEMVAYYDNSLRVIWANRAAVKTAGKPADDLIGRHCFKLWHDRDAPCPDCPVQRTRETGRPDEAEKTMPSGQVWSLRTYPVFDERGVVTGVVEFGEDVTDSRRAEREIEQLARFPEENPGPVLRIEENGTIAYRNKASDIFIEALLEGSGELTDAWRTRVRQALQTGKRDLVSIVHGKRSFDVTVSPVPSGGYINLYASDVTERARMEDQLRQAQKMDSIGRLAGGVAHDFNNMLMAILNYAELARDEEESGQPVAPVLDEITKIAKRSAALTHQLLAFARRQTVKPKVLDLNDTIEGMLKMLRRLLGEHIVLVWEPGRHVWNVRMDPSQVDQIFANLCLNARDAIEGSGEITIETDVAHIDETYCANNVEARHGEFAVISVSDDGCGMSAQIRSQIFEPFFTTKATGEGTGLGLATVYGIVKQNGGFVNVYSEPGEGTTFRIYLPRHISHSPAEEAKSAPERDLSGSETILLVEDEESIRVSLRRFLVKFGYTVLVAASPREALQLVAEHAGPIDLLLTDVVMPHMSGRELADRLQADHPDLKVLYMSGYTANTIAHHGVLDQGVHFMSKPFTRDELGLKMRDVLEAD
jgi:two-component system, cell cycle sensor histidine kinase and response regulator CckA